VKTNFALLLAITLTLSLAPQLATAQTPSSAQLLERSIARHDPQGRWEAGVFELSFVETRPDGDKRLAEVMIDNRHSRFSISTDRNDAKIDGTLDGDECSWRLNGSTEFSDQEAEKYRLTCEFLQRMRNYYVYLWGLPMKLKDPGTLIDEEVTETDFMGKTVWSIRVSYEEDVGSDTWYFYFDPTDASLVGYRFFHDESAGDGEYIILEDEIESGGLVLPAARTWYTNKEDKLLGTDRLENLRPVR
jgi:hypothetical protein